MQRDDKPAEKSTADSTTCAACGGTLPVGTRFCPECGAAVQTSIACPSCGEPVQAGERFCRYCGTQVAALSSQRPPIGTPQPTARTGPPDEAVIPGRVGAAPGSDTQSESDLRSTGSAARPSYRPLDPFAITCPRCGARGAPGDSFCNSCGLPFDEQDTRAAAVEVDVLRAGLIIRFVARIIDGVITSSIVLAIVLAFGTRNFFYVEDSELVTTSAFYIVGTLIPWIYHAVFLAVSATTPGKRVMGIRVEAVGQVRLGFWRPVLREAVIQAPSLLAIGGYQSLSAVSPVLLIVDVVIGLSRPDRRTLHDLVAGTMAIRVRP